MEELYLISCPSCHAQLQIKALDGNLDIRFCPKCATKIQVIRAQTVPEIEAPSPIAAVPKASPPPIPDKTSEVLPVAPVPEQYDDFEVVDDAASPATTVSVGWNSPAVLPTSFESIPLKPEELPPSPYMPLTGAGDAVMPPQTKASSFEQAQPDLAGRPIWTGIYTFPWRSANLPTLFILSFSFTLLLLDLCGLATLYDTLMSLPPGTELSGIGSLVHRASAHVFICLCVCGVFISLHQVDLFLRTIEETSGGVDQFSWPREPWFDFLVRWLFVVWTFAVCAALVFVPLRLLATMLTIPAAPFWYLVITMAWLLFPLALLSTLAGGAFWMLLHPMLLLRLLQRPVLVVFLYANAVFFYMPASLLGYLVIVEGYWWLTPLVGVLWAVTLLIYGRVLGRVAFDATEEEMSSRKRKKSRAGTSGAEIIDVTEADVISPDTRFQER